MPSAIVLSTHKAAIVIAMADPHFDILCECQTATHNPTIAEITKTPVRITHSSSI
jgi:hypothetical protein